MNTEEKETPPHKATQIFIKASQRTGPVKPTRTFASHLWIGGAVLLFTVAVYLLVTRISGALDTMPDTRPLEASSDASLEPGQWKLNAQAIAHLRSERFPEAIALFTRIFNETSNGSVKHNLAVAYNNQGFDEYKNHRTDKAESSFRSSIQYDDISEAYLGLAVLEVKKKAFPDAYEHVNKCISLDDTYAECYATLADLASAMDRMDIAVAAIDKALSLKPHNPQWEKLSRRIHSDARISQGANRTQNNSEHFILNSDSETKLSIESDIIRTLESGYNTLDEFFGRPKLTKIVVLVLTKEQYLSSGSGPVWTEGSFDGKVKIPAANLIEVTEQVKETLIHELTHAFIAQMTDNNAPVWLQEGLALCNQGLRQEEIDAFRTAADGSTVRFSGLPENFISESHQSAVVYYAVSYFTVKGIYERFGSPGIKEILASYKESRDDGLALAKVGLTPTTADGIAFAK